MQFYFVPLLVCKLTNHVLLKLLDYFLENHAVMLCRSGKFFFNRKIKDFFQDGENETKGPTALW